MFKGFGSIGNLFGTSGPTLNYDVGEQYSRAFGSWTHFRGTSKEDGSPVSIFKFVGNTETDKVRIATARNGAKRLRTTRHPNILHMKDTLEIENGPELTIYCVTEAVMPLEEHLKDLPAGTHQRDEYFALGLRQVATAVSFLSNDCKLVHGGVSMAAVVVTDRLDWKLSGFDLVSELDSIASGSHGDARIVHSGFMVPDQYKPEEYRRGDWAGIPEGPPWAVDAWGLGCLIQEVYRGVPLSKTDQLRETEHIPQVLLKDYQKLLGSQPARRYNPKKLVDNSSLFANKLVETITFLDNLTLKDSIEKEQFFRHLPRVLEGLAKAPVEKKILPQIAEALLFGSAPALAVPPMLHAAKDLPDDVFAAQVTPAIVKLYASTDKSVRVALMENLTKYSHHLPEKIVDEQIYASMSVGFTDEEAFVRELTLKSVLPLAPKLTQRTHASLLKHLSKLQVDEEPAIRANTTILLGNVARFLAEATAKRVLLNAFTRALRDQFPPARMAGLMALSATISYHEPGEAACRVIPSVAPLTVDVEKDVREQAFKCLDTYTELLKNFSKKLKDGPEAAAAAHAAEAERAPKPSGVLRWAVNAAAKRIGGASGGGLDDDGAPREMRPEDEAAARGVDLGAKAFSSSAPPPRLYGEAYTPTSTPGPSPAPSPAKPLESNGSIPGGGGSRAARGVGVMPPTPERPEVEDDGDGWGDLDDDLVQEEDPEEAAARARLASASSRPAAARPAVSRAAAAPSSGADGGWGDDDDLFGGDEAPAPAPAPAPARPPPASRPARVGGHVSIGAGRGAGPRGVSRTAKPAPMKLGAKKITAADIDLESMLN